MVFAGEVRPMAQQPHCESVHCFTSNLVHSLLPGNDVRVAGFFAEPIEHDDRESSEIRLLRMKIKSFPFPELVRFERVVVLSLFFARLSELSFSSDCGLERVANFKSPGKTVDRRAASADYAGAQSEFSDVVFLEAVRRTETGYAIASG
jgi:hypothetical protein